MVDGTDRLGVIEFAPTVAGDRDDPQFVRHCELVAGLVGHLLAGTAERGELLHRTRRSRPMSPASELLWRLLPPLTAGRPAGDGRHHRPGHHLDRLLLLHPSVDDAVAAALRTG